MKKKLNIAQAGERYRAFESSQQTNLITNLAADQTQMRNNKARCTICAIFLCADETICAVISSAVNYPLAQVSAIQKDWKEM